MTTLRPIAPEMIRKHTRNCSSNCCSTKSETPWSTCIVVSHDESCDESHEPNPPPVNYDHTPADRTGDDSQTHQKLFQQEEGEAGEDFVS